MPQDDRVQPGSYILDTENAAEMARLTKQDRLVTTGMGGLAAAYDDLSGRHHLLDIACGPAGWALDVASTFPHINVVGIDINRQMIASAQAQAQARQLANADFRLVQLFLIKMQAISQEEAEQRYQQLLAEMRSSGFCGLWYYLTARGTRLR